MARWAHANSITLSEVARLPMGRRLVVGQFGLAGRQRGGNGKIGRAEFALVSWARRLLAPIEAHNQSAAAPRERARNRAIFPLRQFARPSIPVEFDAGRGRKWGRLVSARRSSQREGGAAVGRTGGRATSRAPPGAREIE